MARSTTRTSAARARSLRTGAEAVTETQMVTVIFGANTEDRKVLLYFPPPAACQIVFASAEARDVGRKLLYYADVADGKAKM